MVDKGLRAESSRKCLKGCRSDPEYGKMELI